MRPATTESPLHKKTREIVHKLMNASPSGESYGLDKVADRKHMANSKRFCAFLSHNSNDKLAVEELAQRLRAKNLEPWLDKWDRVTGEAWQPASEEALHDSATCVVFVGPSGLGVWQNEEIRSAIARRMTLLQQEERFRVIPVLLPGAVRGDRAWLPDFLIATTWVEFRHTLNDETAFRNLERAIRGLPKGQDQPAHFKECPYRGLEFFDVQHAPLFFGRDAITDWLQSALRGTLSAQGPTRFLAIIGTSGSGKSSLARAGLLASLKNSGIDTSADWLITICRPGPSPLESLSDALRQTDGVIFGQGLTANLNEQMNEALRARPSTLHQITRSSLGDAQPARRLVVLVDQFEELFTVCRDDAERQAFISNLLYAARVAQGQTIVLLTMRADFYGNCATHPELAAAISEYQFLVGPLTADELREAIERPAQLAGCEFEPGLVELLVDDVQRQPGALRLLQYGLQRMWNLHRGRQLTTADYRNFGQLNGILEQRAEEVFSEFTEQQQELCRLLFLRLTEPGEGTEDTKRRVSWHKLTGSQIDASGMSEIVRILADERLLTTGGSLSLAADSMVEVAHETLICGWQRLREWIEADRAGLRTHHRLTEAVEEWEKNHRDRGLLYDGTRLSVTREWAAKHDAELSDNERRFLRGSHSACRLRKFIAAGSCLMLLSIFLLIWFEVRQSTRTQESKSMVESLLSTQPSAVDFYLPKLGPFSDIARNQLSDEFRSSERKKEPGQCVRAVYGLIHLDALGDAPLGTPEVEFLLDSIATLTKDEGPNIVAALVALRTKDSQGILSTLTGRLQSSASDDALRNRWLAISAGLKLSEPLLALCKLQADPRQRTSFIHSFSAFSGDVKQIATWLDDEKLDPEIRSALCIAVGTLKTEGKQATRKVLEKLYQTAVDGGTHSAARWALLQQGVTEEELEGLNRERTEIDATRDWYVSRAAGITMLKVLSGCITLGNVADDKNPTEEDQPVSSFDFDKAVWISDREISVGQFEALMPVEMKSQPELDIAMERARLNNPASYMTWFDAVVFCNRLSKEENLPPYYQLEEDKATREEGHIVATADEVSIIDPPGQGYRLPTEIEWEYASRAMSETNYSTGESPKLLSDYAVFNTDPTNVRGKRIPNGWGLFEMHGNVSEWCWDKPDSTNTTGEDYRVMRGGSFYDFASPQYLGSADRVNSTPRDRNVNVGFRVFRTP